MTVRTSRAVYAVHECVCLEVTQSFTGCSLSNNRTNNKKNLGDTFLATSHRVLTVVATVSPHVRYV